MLRKNIEIGSVAGDGVTDFFFQAEDGIRDRLVTGVQTVCSSDLAVECDLFSIIPISLLTCQIDCDISVGL